MAEYLDKDGVQWLINKMKQSGGGASLLDVYPVGSIYMSVNSTSPASLFGGTWERIQDRFLLAAGSTYSAGRTGGEATHTLTTSEMPAHSHDVKYQNINRGTGTTAIRYLAGTGAANAYSVDTTTVGGGQAHNNMPPYLAVYVWKRTA